MTTTQNQSRRWAVVNNLTIMVLFVCVVINSDKCSNNSLHVCGLLLCLPVHVHNKSIHSANYSNSYVIIIMQTCENKIECKICMHISATC